MAAERDRESADIDQSSSSSEPDASSSEDENDPSLCSLCHATDRVTTQIAGCDELKSITEYIESTSNAVKKVKYSCLTCLYKLYTIIDQNRLKAFREEREHRLATVAALIESTGAPNPSSLNDSTAVDNTTSTAPANTSSLSSATVSTTVVAENVICNDDLGNESPSLLVPNEDSNALHNKNDDRTSHDEETENINNQLQDLRNEQNENQQNLNRSHDIISNPSSSPGHLDILYEHSEAALITESGGTLDQYKSPPLQCRYCPKVFVLQKPYNRHMSSHQKKIRSIRSSNSSRSRLTPIIYVCNDCSATFDSSVKLKTHCRIHMKRYYCTYCHKENLSLFDHDFHEAECKGVNMAKEEFAEPRRMTRSIARSMRSAQSTKPAKSVASRRNSLTKTVTAADSDDDDGDCETSVAYTDYTGVNSFVERWVAGTYRSEYGRKKPSECEDPEEVVVSQKEHEILMLEDLLIQSGRNVYTCNVWDCDHVTNTLRDMCLHEILTHKYKTYYSCRKCRGVFPSKLFLDYHFYMQTYADYRCNKCPMRYNYEYQLQYHLLQHQKKDSYTCLYCGNSYMSQQELRIHSIDTAHDPKKRKKTISIESRMTIANETASEPPPPKRTYKCTINIMKLPKLPTKRPMNITWPKGVAPLFLGDIDFEYQPRRNCVRTK